MKYSCETCLYSTNSKSHFDTHKKSKSHLAKENNNFEAKYECVNCKKQYKSCCGYYTHRRKCESNKKIKEEEKVRNNDEIRQLVIDLYKQNNQIMRDNNAIIKENAEMKNMLIELSKKDIGNNIITNNIENNNTNNNKIDINIFLNEKCKHAIDMTSLIETIIIGIEDIKNIEKDGYVKTITDILTEKLQGYSLYERPLHYYIENQNREEEDTTNDTIHIRDNGKWNQEDLCEHDVLLTNINMLNDAFLEKTEKHEQANQMVTSGRRYNRTGKIITNILDKVKLSEEQLC